MLEFFAMGGYGTYVWTSFGLTFVVLAGNLWLARRRHNAVIAQLRRRMTVEAPDAHPGFKELVT